MSLLKWQQPPAEKATTSTGFVAVVPHGVAGAGDQGVPVVVRAHALGPEDIGRAEWAVGGAVGQKPRGAGVVCAFGRGQVAEFLIFVTIHCA